MLASRRLLQKRAFSSSNYYIPSLTERRPGEAGPGGKNSEAALKVALFGASGFLGKFVCCDLGNNGVMAYLANRGDDLEMRHLKVNFDLGRSRFVFYSPRDRESIKEVIADADVVVNMIGKYYESGQPYQTSSFPYVSYRTNYSFHDTNVVIPQTLAEVCKEMQVDAFVHVSSASASPDAKSEWSRTKYEGELAVKEAYPWATIIRPTQLFGKDDRFLTWFARIAQWYRMVPLVNNGKVLTQPVWAGDVARTILRVCDDAPKYAGKRIDCFGPADYTYEEVAHFVDDITERNKGIYHVPHSYLRALASVTQYTREPLLTPDLVDVMAEDFLPSMDHLEDENVLTMKDLGIVDPLPIQKDAFSHLQGYRVGGHFARVSGYH